MDIHEYQAKEILLPSFGVPDARAAASPTARSRRPIARREIGGELWVVKAQIHSGGRGKAGGVKLCRDEHEVEDAADELLGKRLVTHQTGPRGKVVYRLYVEGAVADRSASSISASCSTGSRERVMVVASSAGGMEIEEIAPRQAASRSSGSASSPPSACRPFQAREIAFALGLEAGAGPARRSETILGCYRAFRDLDATMVEINPLVVTEDGTSAGARRQDDLRRQRAVPPPAHRRAARQVARRIRARPAPPTAASPMSASTAISAASSTAPASPWRPWT